MSEIKHTQNISNIVLLQQRVTAIYGCHQATGLSALMEGMPFTQVKIKLDIINYM
jgi:hypothetical protein